MSSTASRSSAAPMPSEASPLTAAQRAALGKPAVLVVIDVVGPVDADKLRRSFDHVITQHPALGTTFILDDGIVTQQITPPAALSWRMSSLPNLQSLEHALTDMASTTVNSSGPSVLDAALFTIGPAGHCIAISLNPLSCDRMSTEVVAHELLNSYLGHPTGSGDYETEPAHQQIAAEATSIEAAIRYWRRANDLAALMAPSTFGGERIVCPLSDLQGVAGAALAAAFISHYGNVSTIAIEIESNLDRPPRSIGCFAVPVTAYVTITDGDCLDDVREATHQAAVDAVRYAPFREHLSSELHARPAVIISGGNTGIIVDGPGCQFTLRSSAARATFALGETTSPARDGLADAFVAFAQRVQEAPTTSLDLVPVISDAQWNEQIERFNDTARARARSTICELFEICVQRNPDATAVTAPDESISYRELAERADSLAGRLVDAGAVPGMNVGICVGRSVELIVAVLGILKSGAAYVPLDPSLPHDRLDAIIAEAAVQTVVTRHMDRNRLPPGVDRVVYTDDPIKSDDLNLSGRAKPDDVAYVLFTSGSTGVPKGVMVSHSAVTNLIESTVETCDILPTDVVLQFSTIAFDVSVLEIFLALCVGGRLVVPSSEVRLSPDKLRTLIRREQVTVVDIPPAMLQLLSPDNLPSLRVQFIGCEAFSAELAKRWQAPTRRLINGYGPTETTVMVTLMDLEGDFGEIPPIGYPMPNHEIYILDAHLRPTPPGVTGEIYIGGTGLAVGYFRSPLNTAERFVPNPFATDGTRLYRTGDLGRFGPRGALEFVGRKDNQVKVNGFRIELGDIEAALTQHPGIDAAVVSLERDDAGTPLIIAYITVGQTPIGSADVRQFLSGRLPHYMVPRRILTLTSFPVLPSGKIDRSALSQIRGTIQS